VPRHMFGDIVEPSVKVGTKQWYTVPVSILVHTVAILALIVIPLMAADVLPTPPSMLAFAAAPAPKPVVEVNPAAAPIEAPKEIAPEPPDTSFERAAPAGITGGIVGGVIGGIPEAPPPPPPPPAAPVRVGGNIKPPMKTKDVRPSYPPIAQSARVQGVVIIEATIGPNGKVQDARVLRSIPLLDAAALDAVRQWEFTPTLLNGVPVPVIMTVTVQFTLS
jgi:protein TonB